VNAEFDLGLRPRPGRLDNPALARQVRELSVQALLGAGSEDAALLRREFSGEFLEHLEGCGVPLPRILVHPEIDPESRLRPFGWSDEAIELNRRHRRPADHPPPSTIRRVNSRSFALDLETDLLADAPGGTVLDGRTRLEIFLGRAPRGSEWVIKFEHGNSGLANRRLRAPGLSAADARFVDSHFAEDDLLVVEPWLERERDWCVVFEVPFVTEEMRIHETTCTSDGALIGALYDPDGPPEFPWREELAGMAAQVASSLEKEGYFGPVCVDAFGWRDGDRVRLRSLVDLNCRRSMSDGAYRLWRRLAPERTWYYRFFNRRKLKLPETWPEALAALGGRRYDPARNRGVLLASPLEFGKLAVIFVAGDRSEVFNLEKAFRARFES
jgi:hypothetical protein